MNKFDAGRGLEEAMEVVRDHEDHDKYCDACSSREAIATAALAAFHAATPCAEDAALVEACHTAMQEAPHDNKPYRLARAVLRLIDARMARRE